MELLLLPLFNFHKHQVTVTITILDIIQRFVSYLKHDVSEAAFCLRHQVEPTQLGPIDRYSLDLRFGPKRRVLNKTVLWIMFRNVVVMSIYYRHKPIHLIYQITMLNLSINRT
jgi:hypothetical protein